MSRESCISHPVKQAIAIVRQDYYQLTGRDACAAALLNIFEYWANGALSADPSIERPWVGARPVREFAQMLLGIATDKQIRKRLAFLEEKGFIQTRPPAKRGAAKEYRVLVPEIQQAISGQITKEHFQLRSFDRGCVGQMTEGVKAPWSNDQLVSGQITEAPLVKQPESRRSNDRALKNISQEFKKENSKEDNFCLSDPSEISEAKRELLETEGLESVQAEAVPVGAVRYVQPPESIDLAELWIESPEKARVRLRAIAPGHKRLAMVAHSLGHWWVGPGLNDFDELLIRACQKRKRKFQQPDSESDAKTFINNMIRNGDWANFALRCDEAKALRRPASHQQSAPRAIHRCKSPFERSAQEQRESALGLARFKVARGEIRRAISISEQFGFSRTEIGLSEKVVGQPSLLRAA